MRPPAIVTYMGYSGLGIVRSLGRRGIPVYSLDPNAYEIGMPSRFSISRICPYVETAEERNLDFLVHFARALPEKPVLFLTGDNLVHSYAKREHLLEHHVRLTMPSSKIIRKVAAKDALFHTAREYGIPVPETFAPRSVEDVRAISRIISFPCLIKPTHSNSWHGAAAQRKLKTISGGSEKSVIAHSRESLLVAYSQTTELGSDVIISEVIPGEDRELLYFAFYRSADGRIWNFSGRKERVTPVHLGSASYVVSLDDPELNLLSMNFLERLEYHGLGGLEFKRDFRDGRLKLIEFNTRFGLWDALGQRVGVDTAHIAYRDAIGETLPPPRQARTGVKWFSVAREFGAVRGYRREGSLRLTTWVRSLSGEKMWAVFPWDDPIPAVAASVRFACRALRHVAVTLRSRIARPAPHTASDTNTLQIL